MVVEEGGVDDAIEEEEEEEKVLPEIEEKLQTGSTKETREEEIGIDLDF